MNAIPASPKISSQFPTLYIREVSRLPEQGPEDRLQFKHGVNVLVGVPNTGKSKWLRMIDYLFGDDKSPQEAFDVDVANKYHTVRAAVVVAGQDWMLERTWSDPKASTKITVNGEQVTLHTFTLMLTAALKIPLLHYPQGNPYGPRSWPELGWRSLFRHMYRRQKWWSDIADQQFNSEQHACILQFLGLAEILFSEQYGQLVTLEKKIEQLKSTREQYISMLQEVSRDLVDEKELGVALTPDSIATAIKRQEQEIADVDKRRSVELALLLDKAIEANAQNPKPSKGAVEKLGEELAGARVRQQENASAQRRTDDRLQNLRAHRALISEELARMQRAMDAGTLLADLKITHCPACDRPVNQPDGSIDHCYLCQRPIDPTIEAGVAAKRLEFEIDQLKAEVKETDQLINILVKDLDRLDAEQLKTEEQIERLEVSLKPIRTAAASVLPPELAVFDQQTGRLQERIAQLRRIRSTLDRRETIAAEIETIQNQVGELEVTLAEQSKALHFERSSDLLSDGINTYLNVINEIKAKSWSQQEVRFDIHDRNFRIRIGEANWQSKLGGTLTLFFLMGYHYALMTLVGKNSCHFPGFTVLDFPAQLDGVKVSNSENFVLEPFVRLLAQPAYANCQVIAAGSSFQGLAGAHRIELTKVWV